MKKNKQTQPEIKISPTWAKLVNTCQPHKDFYFVFLPIERDEVDARSDKKNMLWIAETLALTCALSREGIMY